MKNWKYIEGAKTGNEKAISSTFYMNDYGVEVGQWSWDWRGKAPDEKKQNEIAQKIKSYVQQINKNVPAGDSDERDEVFSKLDKFVRSQGLNKKTGNEKTGAEEFFKKLAHDVDEREKKDDADIEKVSNQSPQERLNQDLSIIKEECRKKGISLSFSELAKELEKYGWDFNELRKLKLPVSVGNALNWDENLVGKFVWVKDKGQEWKVYVMQDKGDKVYIRDDEDGSQGWVSKTRITGKVGNTKTGNYSKEELLKYAKQYGDKELIDHIMSGKMTQAELGARTRWFQYQWDGRDINGKIVDKEKAGNSKTGNVQYHKVGKITIRLEANDDEWTVYDTNGHELKSGKGGLGRAKTWAEHFARFTNKRTGNSASDDKFAYVMREFDEGKLKTPDGKVVTDPAQAKAIAYSESKKTENGLARARKAMNKKVENHDFEEGDYVLYNGQKAVVRGFNGQEVIIEQNGRRITTHWSNLEEYE